MRLFKKYLFDLLKQNKSFFQDILGIDLNYYNLTDPTAIFNEDWLESSTQIPCKNNATNPFPKVKLNFLNFF